MKDRGKSSGFRTIIVYQENDKAELQYFKKLGNDLLALNSAQLEQFLEQKVLFDLEEVE